MRSAEWKIWSDKLRVRVWPLGSRVEGLGPNGRGNCSPSKISLRVIARGKDELEKVCRVSASKVGRNKEVELQCKWVHQAIVLKGSQHSGGS